MSGIFEFCSATLVVFYFLIVHGNFRVLLQLNKHPIGARKMKMKIVCFDLIIICMLLILSVEAGSFGATLPQLNRSSRYAVQW